MHHNRRLIVTTVILITLGLCTWHTLQQVRYQRIIRERLRLYV